MSTTSTAVAEVLASGERLRRRYFLSVIGLLVALLVAATLGLSIGAVQVPLGEVWSTVARHLTGMTNTMSAASSGMDTIIWQIRAPRVVMGALVGAGLSVIGLAVQAMVRNPLADPYILGIQSGASAGAVAVVFFGGALGAGLVTPALGAFAGALVTLALVFRLSRQDGRVSSMRLLLVGVSLSFALSGITTFMQYSTRNPAGQAAILFWLIGSLGGSDWPQVPLMSIALVLTAAYVWYHARQLNVLAIGDESAKSLGMNPDRLRVRLFIALSLVVAVAVSMVGPIGFVGLVVPHVARLMVGAEHRRATPVTLLLGATYMVAVDTLSRWVLSPSEVPAGVLTAILGSPFFIWMIRRRDTKALGDAR